MKNSEIKYGRADSVDHRSPTSRHPETTREMFEVFSEAQTKPNFATNEELWIALLNKLNLPLTHQPAIARVLSENRWRTAANPKAYVATAAYLEAKRLRLVGGEIPDIKRVELSDAQWDGKNHEDLDMPSREERLENFLHRTTGSCTGRANCPVDQDIFQRVPQWLQGSTPWEIDWQTVAQHAVVKTSMQSSVARVLRMRFSDGLSRDKAVLTAKTVEAARTIEAAWKWIDRNLTERIKPLFYLDFPPKRSREQIQDKSAPSFCQPWKHLERLTNKEHPMTISPGPSIMVPLRKFPRNTMPISPELGVCCREINKAENRKEFVSLPSSYLRDVSISRMERAPVEIRRDDEKKK
jgi:hypothetical protein